MPQLSVITACYNHGQYIHEMLESLDQQTFQDFEVIIVNDGSTDQTKKILEDIIHPKVSIFHIQNSGPSFARNFAIQKSKSNIIVNLDADDKFEPTFLEKCLSIMMNYDNVGIVYSNVELFGYQTGKFNIKDYNIENMLRANCIVANACFRKNDWEMSEGYSSEMVDGYEDYDFWLSILELGREVYQIKESLSLYRTYENPLLSRSGRRKSLEDKVLKVRIQAFRRHPILYLQFPKIYHEFRNIEHHYQLNSKDKAPPVFSIITPTNNRPIFLIRNIYSVINQSFKDWEQIIVDDANSEETAQLIAEINDPRIRYYTHQQPKGAAAAYNTGIENAYGLYINFLDDDDEYLPEILDKIHDAFLSATNNPGFVWTGITKVKDTEHGEETVKRQQWPAVFPSKKDGLMVSTAIGNGFGLSVKKECVKEIGRYDESLMVGEDTDFLIRLSAKFNFCTIPEVLVKIHIHGITQLTHEKYIKVKWNVYAKLLNRHFDFLSQHWEVINMHNSVYTDLCYQLNEKKAGRKAMWRMFMRFPGNYLTQKDLICYFLFGKDSHYCHAKYKDKKSQIMFRKNNIWYQTLNTILKKYHHYKDSIHSKKLLKEMDDFRDNYDTMGFKDLVEKANIWLHQYPEQASYKLPIVEKWMQEYTPSPCYVLEVGGWRGDLADTMLHQFDSIKCWDNFDVISDSSTQKCKHPLYQHKPLSDYIWNLETDTKYNTLISTHMIEHLKWRELIQFIRWIPDNIQTVLLEAPIAPSAENYNWKGHFSTHILEKGWKQVIGEMMENNFKVVHSEADTYIFNKVES